MKRIRENTKAAALLILAAGGMLRLFYVCFSTIYDRQYDIGLIDLDAGHTVTGGHLAYIQYLYENWRMPDFDPTSVYQFHHPPLHHFLCAAWMKFVSLFIKDTAVVEESIQAIPFVCSLLILWVLLRIVRQFDLQERTVRYLMALFAFHPALVLLSGSVNNDCLALLFTLLCVCYAIEWGRAPSMGCIGKLALVLGLGMMTKQSVAEMAFPIGAVFLYVLLVRIREGGLWGKSVKDLARQFGIFGLISVPLGMWFYVRNLLRYQVSFLWVYELPEDSWQYTGNVSLINRFLWPIPQEMVDNLKNFRIGCGYNVWMQIIRTSVLGEWDMAEVGKPVKLLAVFLMLLGGILALAALVSFVWTFGITVRVKRMDPPSWLLCVAGYLVTMIGYFIFAYKFPQQCSMHFRYIEITLLFPALGLGFVLQEQKNRWLNWAAWGILGCFGVCSVLMTGVWCLGVG